MQLEKLQCQIFWNVSRHTKSESWLTYYMNYFRQSINLGIVIFGIIERIILIINIGHAKKKGKGDGLNLDRRSFF